MYLNISGIRMYKSSNPSSMKQLPPIVFKHVAVSCINSHKPNLVLQVWSVFEHPGAQKSKQKKHNWQPKRRKAATAKSKTQQIKNEKSVPQFALFSYLSTSSTLWCTFLKTSTLPWLLYHYFHFILCNIIKNNHTGAYN